MRTHTDVYTHTHTHGHTHARAHTHRFERERYILVESNYVSMSIASQNMSRYARLFHFYSHFSNRQWSWVVLTVNCRHLRLEKRTGLSTRHMDMMVKNTKTPTSAITTSELAFLSGNISVSNRVRMVDYNYYLLLYSLGYMNIDIATELRLTVKLLDKISLVWCNQ